MMTIESVRETQEELLRLGPPRFWNRGSYRGVLLEEDAALYEAFIGRYLPPGSRYTIDRTWRAVTSGVIRAEFDGAELQFSITDLV